MSVFHHDQSQNLGAHRVQTYELGRLHLPNLFQILSDSEQSAQS